MRPLARFKFFGDKESPLTQWAVGIIPGLRLALDRVTGALGMKVARINRTFVNGVKIEVTRCFDIDNISIFIPPTIIPPVELPVYEPGYAVVMQGLFFVCGDNYTMFVVDIVDDGSKDSQNLIGLHISFGDCFSATVNDQFDYDGMWLVRAYSFGSDAVDDPECWDAISRSADISIGLDGQVIRIRDVMSCYYKRYYEINELTAAATYTKLDPGAIYIDSPAENKPQLSEKLAAGGCPHDWFKTWNNLCLGLHLYAQLDGLYYGVTASMGGVDCAIGGNALYPGGAFYNPSISDNCPDYSAFGWDASDDGQRIYLMSQSDLVLRVFAYDGLNFILDAEYPCEFNPDHEIDTGNQYTRLLGIDGTTAYFVQFGGGHVYSYDMTTGHYSTQPVSPFDVTIKDAVWNDFDKRPYPLYHEGRTVEEPDDSAWSTWWRYSANEFWVGTENWGTGPEAAEHSLNTDKFETDGSISMDMYDYGCLTVPGPGLVILSPNHRKTTPQYTTRNYHMVFEYQDDMHTLLGAMAIAFTNNYFSKGSFHEPSQVVRRLINTLNHSGCRHTSTKYYTDPGCWPEGAFQINGGVLIQDPQTNVSGTYTMQEYTQAEDRNDHFKCVLNGPVITASFGDSRVAGSSFGGFPHMFGWKAILYNAKDKDGANVKRDAICYNDFIKYSDGEILTPQGLTATQGRAFWIKIGSEG